MAGSGIDKEGAGALAGDGEGLVEGRARIDQKIVALLLFREIARSPQRMEPLAPQPGARTGTSGS